MPQNLLNSIYYTDFCDKNNNRVVNFKKAKQNIWHWNKILWENGIKISVQAENWKMLIITTVEGVGKLWPTDQIWLVTCFYKKVLLGHSHVHAFTYCLWLHSTKTADLSNYSTDCIAHRPKNIYYLAIYKKSLPTPSLDQSWAIT